MVGLSKRMGSPIASDNGLAWVQSNPATISAQVQNRLLAWHFSHRDGRKADTFLFHEPGVFPEQGGISQNLAADRTAFREPVASGDHVDGHSEPICLPAQRDRRDGCAPRPHSPKPSIPVQRAAFRRVRNSSPLHPWRGSRVRWSRCGAGRPRSRGTSCRGSR
jgi:hypothetical protein